MRSRFLGTARIRSATSAGSHDPLRETSTTAAGVALDLNSATENVERSIPAVAISHSPVTVIKAFAGAPARGTRDAAHPCAFGTFYPLVAAAEMATATPTLVARDVVSPWRKLVGIVARSIAQHFGLRNRRRYHHCYPGASVALHSARNRARTPLPVHLLINDGARVSPSVGHPIW